MSVQFLVDVVLGVALVVFLGYRQTTWRYTDPTRIWRTPLVLGLVGVVVLAQTVTTITTLDVVFLGAEALLTIAVGLATGAVTRFRTVATPDGRGRTLQSRTGWAGAALWVVLIAARVGLDVLGGHLGAHLLTATGTILLVLALNRAARALVIDQRIPRPARPGARGMMVR